VVFWSVTMAVAYIVLLLRRCQPAVREARVFLMRRLPMAMIVLAGVLSAFVYAWAQQRLSGLPRATAAPELLISLPRFAQVLMAGGDRYLAANLAGFRVLVADTGRMDARRLCGAGRLQRDIAWFNPAHEDNYYIAAAILPWNGQLDAAQYVLRRLRRRGPLTGTRCFSTVSCSIIFARTRRPARSGCSRPFRGSRTSRTSGRCRMSLPCGSRRAIRPPMRPEWSRRWPQILRRGAFRNYLQVRARRLRDLAAAAERRHALSRALRQGMEKLQDLVSSGLARRASQRPAGVWLRPRCFGLADVECNAFE
jgi:hypothetical protein